MATYLQSLLGEDELNTVKRDARGMSLLQAGLAGLMASGPSLTPTSAGQALGAAGLSGLSSYQNAMKEAERQGLQSREMQQQQTEKDRQRVFSESLQGVYTPSGQINYDAVQKLIVQFPDLAPAAVAAIKSGARPIVAPPKPDVFTLKPGEQRFEVGPDGKPRLIASAEQPKDFKLDRSVLTMMQNVFGTTDFDRLTPTQQVAVNRYQNAPDSTKQAELQIQSNQMRFDTGINVPVPKSRDDILLELLKSGEATPQAVSAAAQTPESGTSFPQALTPMQQKIDQAFAPDFVQWTTGGGSDVLSQLGQVQTVIDALERGESLTGIGVSIQPDILLAMTNPEALQSRELVESVVQRNLRVILGAQFTEKEGERLISRAYNPRLKPEQNAARLRNLFLQMSTAANQKQEMVDYVQQNGSLRGYKGKMPSINDFYKAIEVPAKAKPKGVKPLDQIFK
jgi:hypothetical protein